MSIFEKIAENKIQEAIENGTFERLTNKGQPLQLDEYFATPEAFRLAHTVLKNAHVVPAEIDLLRELGQLQQQIETCAEEPEKHRLRQMRDAKQMQLRLLLERNQRKK
jgi:Domain of unknown function (DUF1992)